MMMIAVEKILASFLTFPGIFLVVWAVIMIYLILKARSFFIKVVATVTFIIMLITFTGFGVRLLLFPLENYTEYNQDFYNKSYPIVVLGSGIKYGVGSEGAELSSISLQRLVEGYLLYKKLGGIIIPTGGIGVGQEKITEADIAGKWLEKMGVAEEDIILEKQAQTTYENAIFIKKWLKDSRYEKIYLVTSAVHMPRSVEVFKKIDINLIPVPAGYMYDHKLSWLDYFPDRYALTANMSALHEWIGIIWYKMNGRL